MQNSVYEWQSRQIRSKADFSELINDIITNYQNMGYAVCSKTCCREKYGESVTEMRKDERKVTIYSRRRYTCLSNIVPDVDSILVYESGKMVFRREFYIFTEKTSDTQTYCDRAEECEQMMCASVFAG